MSSNNDQQQPQPRIVEDRPVFYGMAVGSRLEPALRIESAPLIKPNRSSNTSTTTTVVGLEKTTTDKAPTTRLWPAKAELEPLPVIYILERTHACIPDASSQEVGRRVVCCLQRKSIAAEFHDAEVSFNFSKNIGARSFIDSFDSRLCNKGFFLHESLNSHDHAMSIFRQ
jgi:hypothetical protein